MANKIHLRWQDLFSKIELKEGQDNDLIVYPEIVPIVFVPGIMGSVLKRQVDGTVMWDPSDVDLLLERYGGEATPRQKREFLIGDDKHSDAYLEVRRDNSAFGPKRGWEGVSESSYELLRVFLETAQWSEQIQMCFHMPVHAFGYNWTCDPRVGGVGLAKYIRLLTAYYNNPQEKIPCKQVILVTHSMGGLVARAACQSPGISDKVLGVVHAVQPATGAPAAYWRMKCGFEIPSTPNPLQAYKNILTARVLGVDAREVTALLGNMPGGLSLLPSHDYTDARKNNAWLMLTRNGEVLDRLPRQARVDRHVEHGWSAPGGPYEDIYRRRGKAWGLVDPTLLHPGGDPQQAWEWYLDALQQAEDFHTWLMDRRHPNTWHIYGRGLPTPDKIELELTCVTPQLGANLQQAMRNGRAPAALHNGPFIEPPEEINFDHSCFDAMECFYGKPGFVGISTVQKAKACGTEYSVVVSMQKFSGSGDGTVPTSSALSLPYLDEQDDPSRVHPLLDVEHEPAMQSAETHEFIKTAIREMCHKKMYDELTAAKVA